MKGFTPTPVETQAGEDFRQQALALLTARWRLLAESPKTDSLSAEEATELRATGRALTTLAAMAPVEALIPLNAKDWFVDG